MTRGTWTACGVLAACTIVVASCSDDAVARPPDGGTPEDGRVADGAVTRDVGATSDGGGSGCAEDCTRFDETCRRGRCVEGACVVDDLDGPCDDGDPCTSTDQCLAGACLGFPVDDCCVLDCDGAACGDDGCGGSCGECARGELCGPERTCVPESSAGDTCDAPTEITATPFRATGDTSRLADDYAMGDGGCLAFGVGEGGADAVYRYRATMDTVLLVSLHGLGFRAGAYAVTDCADLRHSCVAGLAAFGIDDLGPMSVPVQEGDDVYLIVDGDGVESGTYTIGVESCAPDCAGAECGTDGCGQLCERQCPLDVEWSCTTARTCVCEPSCSGRECGSDGCLGTCGDCGTGRACDASGRCVTDSLAGDTAGSAIPIGTSAFTYSGDTTGYGNDATAWWACQGGPEGPYLGIDAPDILFSVQPPTPTAYYVQLRAEGFLESMYAVRDPTDILSCIQAGYEPFTLRTQLFFEASPAAPTYVVVDGYTDGSGRFTLDATPCVRASDCPMAREGQFCSLPIVAGAIPFTHRGSVESLDAYSLPAGGCGTTREAGRGGKDAAIRFVAETAGRYTVRVQGVSGFDPVVYVTTDCQDLARACLAFSDREGGDGAESVEIDAVAGTPYFVIVDSLGVTTGSFDLEVTRVP